MYKKIKVGCCGFPCSKEEYFKKFDVIEIQKTFYKIPKLETVENWREESPKEFEFCIKASQLITHSPESPTYRKAKLKGKNCGFFKQTDEVFSAWEKTKEIAEILNSKIIIFQTPASFLPNDENKENIRNFFNEIKSKSKSKNFIFCWEPRGKWKEEEIKEICKSLNLVDCVDPFKRKQCYGKISYFRLHGKKGYGYKYTEKDLKKILSFCLKKENYVMFNNISMFNDSIKFKQLLL